VIQSSREKDRGALFGWCATVPPKTHVENKMFILDQKTGELSEKAAFCHFRGIDSGSLLYLPNKDGENDETKPIGLWMLGVDSRAFKKAVGLNQQKQSKAKKINLEKLTPDEMVELVLKGEKSNADIVVAMTTGWDNFCSTEGPVKFTSPLLKDWLLANPGYKEQAVTFYTDRANHLGNV
jgi:hypothetical protein